MGAGQIKPAKTSVLDFMNRTAADAFIRVNTGCTSSVRVNQDVTLEARRSSGGRLEDTSACVACVQDAGANYAYYLDLQRRKRPKAPTDALAAGLEEDLRNCATRCKSLVLRDSAQTALVKSRTNCTVSNQLAATWAASVSADFNSALYSDNDTAAAILDVTRASRKERTKTKFLSTQVNRLTAELASRIQSNLDVDQTVTVNGDAAVGYIHQDVLVSAIADLIAQASIFDDVLTEQEWTALSTVHEESSTIGPLGTALGDVVGSIERLVGNTFGAIIVALLAILSALVVGLLVYVVVAKDK